MKAPFYKPFKSFLIYDPNDPVQLDANEQGVYFLWALDGQAMVIADEEDIDWFDNVCIQ